MTQLAHQPIDDAHLVDSHLGGDSGALRRLMERHEAALLGFLRGRVGAEAEDLYQETWMRAERALDGYQDMGNFRGWLFQIARRLVIDHHRRLGARIQLVTGVSVETEDSLAPDSQMGAQQLSDCVERAMGCLRPEMRHVVELRLKGLSFKEIAAQQGVPLNTALSRMHRSLEALRTALQAEGHIERNGRKQ